MAKKYRPSRGDIAFRDLQDGADDPFEAATALRHVTDEYLSVLMADNQGDQSKPFLRQVEFEVQRRSADQTKTSNFISIGALAVAALSIIAGIVAG